MGALKGSALKGVFKQVETLSVWSLNKRTKCPYSVGDLTWIINIHTIGLSSCSCTCCADLPVVMSVKGPWKQMLKSFISNCWEEETIAELANQHFNSDPLYLVCNVCTRYSEQKKKTANKKSTLMLIERWTLCCVAVNIFKTEMQNSFLVLQ